MEEAHTSHTIRGSDVIGYTGDRSAEVRVVTYDFRRPDKFSKEQIRTVTIMHETFARLTATSLSAQLRFPIQLHVASVNQLTYEEFIRSIPNPTTLMIVRMSPLKGAALLEIDPSISYAMIDRLFGGQAERSTMTRDHSAIEFDMLSGLAERMLRNLGEAWKPILGLEPELGKIESNPQFAQIVPPSKMVVLVTFETGIGGAKGMINLCIPYITIEPTIPRLSARYWYTSVRNRLKQRETPSGYGANLPVETELCVDAGRIPVASLTQLTRGTKIPVEAWDADEVFVRAGGVRLRCKREVTDRGTRFNFVERGVGAKEQRVIAGKSGDSLDHSEPEDPQDRIEAIRDELNRGFSKLTRRIEELGARQDEVTDQMLLGTVETPTSAPSVRSGARGEPFSFLRVTDGNALLMFLTIEHPQLIALVLSSIEPPTAAHVLQGLDPELRVDVTERIYRMERVAPQVVDRVAGALEKHFAQIADSDDVVTGGYTRAVEILNLVSRSTERQIIEALDARAPDVSEEIKQHMFVFEDIVLLDDASARATLKTTERDDVVTALKGVPDEVHRFVAGHADPELKEYIEQTLPTVPPLRLSEVEAAQQRIVETIRALEREGRIHVARAGEDDLID